MIKYISLTDTRRLLDFMNKESKPHHNGVFVFKHSTRCFVSKLVKHRLEADWDLDETTYPVFLVDVIKDRPASQEIANLWHVQHESPQILYLKNGVCMGNASHNEVSIQTVKSWLNE